MLVKYWMRKTVLTVDANDSLQEAASRMHEYQVHLLPVLQDDRLVGVITDRDLKRASASDSTALERYEMAHLISQVKVSTVMSSPAIAVPPDYTIEETAALLTMNGISGAPVVDEKGSVVGVITQQELFRALISLSGLANRGIQIAFRVEDRPGSIKEVTDVIRKHGGRLVSLLTSYDRAPEGFRNVYVRACGIDRKKLPQMHSEVKKKTQLLYFVDHRENQRVEYVEYLPGQKDRHVSGEPYKEKTRKVLFCTDFSENSIPARVRAVEYAKSLAAELVILHVVSSRTLGYPFVETDMKNHFVELHRKIDERAESELATIAKDCSREWGPVKTYLRSGVPAAEIVRFAETLSADLIVMGTHGWSGLKHLILGSTAENVLRTANCPVLIVRSTPIPRQTRRDT